MFNFLNILRQTFIGPFFLLIVLLNIFSCSQNNPKQPNASEKKNQLKPAVTIPVKAPKVTLLDTCPPPLTITIPAKKKDSFVLNINGSKTVILPPETRPADFSILMQNYNTSDGLALNTVVSSFRDKRGISGSVRQEAE